MPSMFIYIGQFLFWQTLVSFIVRVPLEVSRISLAVFPPHVGHKDSSIASLNFLLLIFNWLWRKCGTPFCFFYDPDAGQEKPVFLLP